MQNQLQTTALENFRKQYPMVNSGDLQAFILGMQAMEKIQESCVLKGIANQLLALSVPTIDELNKMLHGFNFVVVKSSLIEEITNNESKLHDYKLLIRDINDTLLNSRGDDSMVSWINDRVGEIEV
jgi:hypothetical protein